MTASLGESLKKKVVVSSRSRRVLTKVGVTNKEYGFKRIGVRPVEFN